MNWIKKSRVNVKVLSFNDLSVKKWNREGERSIEVLWVKNSYKYIIMNIWNRPQSKGLLIVQQLNRLSNAPAFLNLRDLQGS